jgi:hypothetical protein
MRYARPILNILAFCAIATGSIWVGWTSAGPEFNPTKRSALIVSPRVGEIHPADFGAIDRYSELGLPPGVRDRNFAPRILGEMENTMDLDSPPMISMEAIERASSYSDAPLPEVEIPLPTVPGDTSIGGGSIP